MDHHNTQHLVSRITQLLMERSNRLITDKGADQAVCRSVAVELLDLVQNPQPAEAHLNTAEIIQRSECFQAMVRDVLETAEADEDPDAAAHELADAAIWEGLVILNLICTQSHLPHFDALEKELAY